MDKLIGAIVDFFVSYGGWGIVAVMFILILFFGDKLLASVEGFWSAFRNISSFTFKRYTSTRLANQILHATRVINSINDDLLPYRVKIKWVKSENIESFQKRADNYQDTRRRRYQQSFVLAVANSCGRAYTQC